MKANKLANWPRLEIEVLPRLCKVRMINFKKAAFCILSSQAIRASISDEAWELSKLMVINTKTAFTSP
jgi:hypothetical protein